jgi:uncharacterized protein YndB with AHSA1/START domain
VADLKHQIPINASPQAVYAAIATQGGLASWWTADTRVDEKVGGNAEFAFNKRDAVYRMIIKTLDPGKQVEWTCQGDTPEWTGTTLSWTVTPDAHGSMLRFTHGGWRSASEHFAICNSTWGELMYRLKGYLEGSNPGPRWTE